MSCILSDMSDIIRLPADAGATFRRLRLASKASASQVARVAGRSRDTLHRLETGEDVSLATFLAFLSALGCALEIVPAGIPSLQEMQRRFAAEDDDD